MIHLTELQAESTVSKKYKIAADGTYVADQAANIYKAVARPKAIPFENVASYLDNLTSKHDTCIVLGSCGSAGEEFNLVTEDKRKEGNIARTSEFFKYANSGSVSMMMLDFDSSASNTIRNTFLTELDAILSDSLIGEKGHERSRICRWTRPSSSASVIVNGKAGNGLHVYIAVKGADSKLVKLIHQWCWLQEYGKSHRIVASGRVLPESLVDASTGGAERVVYTSDVKVSGPGKEEHWQHIDRTCDYTPGGIIDCEQALIIMEELTVDYDREWQHYKSRVEKTKEVQDVRDEWNKKQIAKRVELGMDKKKATRIVKNIQKEVILSSDMLLRNDGTEVHVMEILTDFDSWHQVGKFCDPVWQQLNRNVGMILGTAERPFLNCLSGGGVRYYLKWEYEDLMEWVKTAPEDELEDWFGIHTANSEITAIQEGKIIKLAAQRFSLSASVVKKEVEEKNKEIEEQETEEAVTENVENALTVLDKYASHGDMSYEYIKTAGDCRTYGDGFYVYSGGDIWEHYGSRTIVKKIINRYNHIDRCKRKSDYEAVASLVVTDPDINCQHWDQAPGFPCVDGFYEIKDQDVVRVPYAKELGCRFKLGMKPDMSYMGNMPLFQKILDNVDNPVLFQQLSGLVLSGYLPTLQKVFTMMGEGGTGKGTVCSVFTALLPKKRLSSLSINQFNDPVYRVLLADSVVNITSEVPRNKKNDLTGVKEVSGGDLVTGRSLYCGPVSFYSNCGLIISANHYFDLGESGAAVERRFGHSIVKFSKRNSTQVDNLAGMIIAEELPTILGWAMDGVRLYFEHGLDSTESLSTYASWLSSVNVVELFVSEHIEFDSRIAVGNRVTRSGLWNKFVEYCAESHYRVPQKGAFLEDIAKMNRFGSVTKVQGEWRYTNAKWSKCC